MPRQLPANLPWPPGATPAWALALLEARARFAAAAADLRGARRNLAEALRD